MNEPQAAERFLYQTLTGAAAVTALVGSRVYAFEAPEDPTFPYVLLNPQGAGDRRGAGPGSRLFSRLTYLVKAITRIEGDSDALSADAIADAVDAAIDAAAGTVTINAITYRVSSGGRQSPVRYVERKTGLCYVHAGGLYTAVVQKLSG